MLQPSIESEVKLDAGVGFAVPDLAGLSVEVTVTGLPERRLTATYVDTPDLRLLRAGVTLRHRHEIAAGALPVSEWTLKLPMAPAGLVVVRRELRWDGAANEMPAEADAIVRAWRRSSDLDVVARLVTVRQRSSLSDPDGKVLAELDDDIVSVMDGPRLAARFREVELEVNDGTAASLVAEIVERLERAGARRSDGRAKVARALGAPASAPPDVETVRLGKGSTMADVVRAALTDGYLRLVHHHAGVHLDEDLEQVHQARVATRRLRSDLRALRHCLDRDWVRATRYELGWLADALGAVRDADVLRLRLTLAGAALPAEDSPAVEELVTALAEERTAAMAVLVEAMESSRYVALLDRLVAAIGRPPTAGPTESPVEPAGPDASSADPDAAELRPQADTRADPGELRARKELGPAVARPMRHLEAAVAGLGEPPSDDDLHQVRIAAKRLRYACETAVPVCGKDARALGRAAAELQSVLGDFHDAVVASAWLRRTVVTASPAVALAAGQLIARENTEAALLRSSWGRTWKPLASSKLVRWLDM